MTIFLLKESKEYDNYYFIEEYATREEAVKHLDPFYTCKFIEGKKLKLTLTNKNEDKTTTILDGYHLLTQEFFKVFKIEPKYTYIGYHPLTNEEGIIQPPAYPEITAEKLLEMICILNKEAVYGYSNWSCKFIIGETIEELIENILTDCIINKSKVFKQIQQLFKEEV